MKNGCRKSNCAKCAHCITIREGSYLMDCDVLGEETRLRSYCRYFLTKKEAKKVQDFIESQKKIEKSSKPQKSCGKCV